jgi:hypothetical protein
MNTKETITTLVAVEHDKYQAVDLDRLVVYSMIKLAELGVELSLENIIVGAFRLFPKKFSLVGYMEYPDATRVEKALWRCKGKNRLWIGGKTTHGYVLTDRSRMIYRETEEQLDNPEIKEHKGPTRKRRKEAILWETRNSSAYQKYKTGKVDSITDADICFMLQGTLDSSKETLASNFAAFRRLAEELQERDISEFLDWVEIRFQKLIKE